MVRLLSQWQSFTMATFFAAACLTSPWQAGEKTEFTREMEAVKNLLTIQTAETQYDSDYGSYAVSLTQLGPSASGAPGPNGAELIDRDLASGEKGNFKFVMSPTPTGYSVQVTPTVFGTSGNHTFFSDQSMTIHVHNGQEPATANDPALGDNATQTQQGGAQGSAAPAAPAATPPSQ